MNRVIEGGHEPRRFATDMLDRFRDLIVLASVPDAISSGLLDVPPDRADALRGQAERYGLASLTRAADIVAVGLDQMRGATSPRLLLELMCAQVLLPAAASDERSVLARLERLEAGAATAGPGMRAAGGAGPRGYRTGAACSGPRRDPGKRHGLRRYPAVGRRPGRRAAKAGGYGAIRCTGASAAAGARPGGRTPAASCPAPGRPAPGCPAASATQPRPFSRSRRPGSQPQRRRCPRPSPSRRPRLRSGPRPPSRTLLGPLAPRRLPTPRAAL